MNIIERLRSQTNFTGTERTISKYILSHLEEVGVMSASALAKKTFSSNASILRMCRKTGLSGYRELQLSILVYISTRRKVSVIEEFFPSTNTAVTSEDAVVMVSEFIRKASDDCLKISGESILRAAKQILNTDRLFLYASNSLNALRFSHWMSGLGIATLIPELFRESRFSDVAPTRRDTALILSYSDEYVHNIMPEITNLRTNGCYIILISAVTSCPEADIIITLPDSDRDCSQTKMVYSQTVELFMMVCMDYLLHAFLSDSSSEIADAEENKIQNTDHLK